MAREATGGEGVLMATRRRHKVGKSGRRKKLGGWNTFGGGIGAYNPNHSSYSTRGDFGEYHVDPPSVVAVNGLSGGRTRRVGRLRTAASGMTSAASIRERGEDACRRARGDHAVKARHVVGRPKKRKLYTERVRLNSGGYTPRGQYYGVGAPLFACRTRTATRRTCARPRRRSRRRRPRRRSNGRKGPRRSGSFRADTRTPLRTSSIAG